MRRLPIGRPLAAPASASDARRSALTRRRPLAGARLSLAASLLLCLLWLAGCTLQDTVDAVVAPPEGTPVEGNVAAANTPLPSPTPVPIKPRPLGVNIARLSVKPGEEQEIDVTGTPEAFINVITSFSNGDHYSDATVLGAQLDINGTYVDRWKIDDLAPGGSVSVLVQDIKTGQVDRESFLIDAKPWGGPAPAGPAPIVGYVPYGTPGATLVILTPQPANTPGPGTPTVTPGPLGPGTPTPSALAAATPLLPGQGTGDFQVRAYPAAARVPLGGPVRINGTLVDGAGRGVAGARLFAIAHYPSGHSDVWVSPAESGANGLVWVSATVTGVPAGSTILVDVYMTYAGQSYHGQTSFVVG